MGICHKLLLSQGRTFTLNSASLERHQVHSKQWPCSITVWAAHKVSHSGLNLVVILFGAGHQPFTDDTVTEGKEMTRKKGQCSQLFF